MARILSACEFVSSAMKGGGRDFVRQRPEQLLPVRARSRIHPRPALAGEVRKRDPPAPGEPVSGGRENHVLIVVQVFLNDIRRRRRARAGHEKVDLALEQRIHQRVPMANGYVERDPRGFPREGYARVHQETFRPAAAGADVHVSGAARGQVRRFVLHVVQHPLQGPDAGEQRGADRGKGYPVRRALDQLRAHGDFETPQALAERRRAQSQRFRGAADVLFFGHDREVPDVPKLHVSNQNSANAERWIIADADGWCQVCARYRHAQRGEGAMHALHRGMFAAAFVAGLVAATAGLAQTEKNFPSKPIRLVVPFSAGAGVDILARIVSQKLDRELGAVGGDREPNGRRRQARRDHRRQGPARRPYAALDQLRVYHHRGAVSGPSVRSAQGLCRCHPA